MIFFIDCQIDQPASEVKLQHSSREGARGCIINKLSLFNFNFYKILYFLDLLSKGWYWLQSTQSLPKVPEMLNYYYKILFLNSIYNKINSTDKKIILISFLCYFLQKMIKKNNYVHKKIFYLQTIYMYLKLIKQ